MILSPLASIPVTFLAAASTFNSAAPSSRSTGLGMGPNRSRISSLNSAKLGGVGELGQFAVKNDALPRFGDVVERQIRRHSADVPRLIGGGRRLVIVHLGDNITWHGHLELRRGGLAGRSLGALFLAGIHREKIECDAHLDAALDGFALEPLHALLEQLAVKLEADGGDVAALLCAEDVARAANLEVAHGDLESAAELRVLLERADALAGVVEQRGVAWQNQIGKSLVLVTPDAAAQLVQLAQAETVGAVDDDRVGVGDVEAALDDGRREQDVGVAVDESCHHLLERAAGHLAVADDEPRLGHELADAIGHRLDRRHAVVQKEHLPAPVELSLDGVAEGRLVELDDGGLDRQPVLRRRLDGAHVARACERHVQRARDRRRGQREHVHRLPQHLEFLLVQHAEALLLVDDHQAEILEADIGLDELVRADDDVHRAGRQRRDHGVGLFFCTEPREQLHRHGELRHALDERVEMLLRQHGGRHQHGNLFAAHHRLERRADGHLGLAETDVAAHEPVHRLGLLHVPLGRLDGRPLVRCFLERKRSL